LLHRPVHGANIDVMNDLANLARLIENLIRLGTIAAVQMKPPACAGQNRNPHHRLAPMGRR